VGVNKYTDEEKQKHNALMERERAVVTNKENDAKLKPLVAEQKRLQDLINAPKYNIEALTGTWGPEKLPPK